MKKNLILIDDHVMILHGLATYIENHSSWKALFTASSKAQLIQNLSELKDELEGTTEEVQNVALIDIKIGEDDGYEICRLLKEKVTGIKCIMYSMYSTYGNVMYAKECGADGFLSKNAGESELILALDSVASGKTYIQQDLMNMILESSNYLNRLTPREKQIFDMLCENKSKKEICHSLNISQRTCENYLSLLYDKLEVKDSDELKKKYGGQV